MALAALPRRDTTAREHLDEVGVRTRPLVLARDRSVPLAGELADLVPGGAALTRGTVLGVEGCGATSVGFELAAAVSALGEWVAAVDLDGTLGALAAREAGVALDRFAVVRRVPPARWATVVAALLDGVSLVLAEVPRGVSAGRRPPSGGTRPRAGGDPRGARAGPVARGDVAHVSCRAQRVDRAR